MFISTFVQKSFVISEKISNFALAIAKSIN